MSYERIEGETAWQGRFIGVRRERFRYDDGEEAEREFVSHPGAVAVVAHDGERFYMVSQPREAVGEQNLLELPAGKFDEEGEDELATAKRELAEEIGKGAGSWRHLTTLYSSPGFSDERIVLYEATELHDADAETEENERIEVHEIELSELDTTIEACRDAKSLIGLMWFRTFVLGRG